MLSNMDLRSDPMYQRISSPSNETKVCVIIDSKTPIVTRIPVPAGQLTLGAFKDYTSLNHDCYKFYFKSHDAEFGTVKEEMTDDDSTLPAEDGRIVVWVITNNDRQQAAKLFGSENPYDRLGDGVQISDQPDFYKQPATFKLDPRLDQEHVYDQMVAHRPADIQAQLYLRAHDTLGLTILCPSSDISHSSGLLVDKVQPESVAARDGRLRSGDKIIEINGIKLADIPSRDAIMIFKQIVEDKGAINLLLHRDDRSPQLSGAYRTNELSTKMPNKPSTRTGAPPSLVGFDPATELPVPILDPDVLSAPNRYGQQRTHDAPQRDTYSLPRSLTPRSLYTTSNFDTQTSSNDLRLTLDSQSVYGPTSPSSLRQIGVALHCSKDSIGTIYAYLKSDAVSLDIRDREWLKVVVKDAFLGVTLVKWLSRNVYGFCNRSETKRYANKMLSLGLIKGPMSSGTFSDKCYYVLT